MSGDDLSGEKGDLVTGFAFGASVAVATNLLDYLLSLRNRKEKITLTSPPDASKNPAQRPFTAVKNVQKISSKPSPPDASKIPAAQRTSTAVKIVQKISSNPSPPVTNKQTSGIARTNQASPVHKDNDIPCSTQANSSTTAVKSVQKISSKPSPTVNNKQSSGITRNNQASPVQKDNDMPCSTQANSSTTIGPLPGYSKNNVPCDQIFLFPRKCYISKNCLESYDKLKRECRNQGLTKDSSVVIPDFDVIFRPFVDCMRFAYSDNDTKSCWEIYGKYLKSFHLEGGWTAHAYVLRS